MVKISAANSLRHCQWGYTHARAVNAAHARLELPDAKLFKEQERESVAASDEHADPELPSEEDVQRDRGPHHLLR